MPQPPQWRLSEVVSRQAPPQEERPAGQVSWQAPLAQVGDPVGHACAQLPQFCGSVIVSTHVPAQSVVPVGQPHLPSMHALPAPHAVPQPPQFSGSDLMSRQAPLQAISGGAHEPAHWPTEQTWPAGHIVPQPPQFCALVVDVDAGAATVPFSAVTDTLAHRADLAAAAGVAAATGIAGRSVAGGPVHRRSVVRGRPIRPRDDAIRWTIAGCVVAAAIRRASMGPRPGARAATTQQGHYQQHHERSGHHVSWRKRVTARITEPLQRARHRRSSRSDCSPGEERWQLHRPALTALTIDSRRWR